MTNIRDPEIYGKEWAIVLECCHDSRWKKDDRRGGRGRALCRAGSCT